MRVYDIIKEDSDLNEAPMGFLKRAGNKLASLVPGDTIGPGAQGRLETGKLANQIKKEYSLYLGKAGKKPDSDNLMAFLQSKGLPTEDAAKIINPISAIAQPAAGANNPPPDDNNPPPNGPGTQASAAPTQAAGTPMSTTATATPGATTPASTQSTPFVGRRERARQAAQTGAQPAAAARPAAGTPMSTTATATPGAQTTATPSTSGSTSGPAATPTTPSKADQTVKAVGAQSDKDIMAKDRATRAATAATASAPAATGTNYDIPTFMRQGKAAPVTTPKPTVTNPKKPALTQPKVAESKTRKLREATALSGSQVDKAILAAVQAAQNATALGGSAAAPAAGGSAPAASGGGGGLGAAFRAGASGGAAASGSSGRSGALTLPQMKQLLKKVADNLNNLTEEEKIDLVNYVQQIFRDL